MARLQPQIQTTEEGAGMARRRSARLHPQIQASEEGAGVTRRRSPRLHPQTQPSGDGPGVICRRSPPLHPQIEATEEGAGVNRRGTSPASLPDDDDMLREILLRLPPQPSSLPRASAVCKRWRGLVTDPKFHRQFYAHHRKPPLFGVFSPRVQGIAFDPILDPPDRIPTQRFSLGQCSSSDYNLLDCHHGLVLLKDYEHGDLVVCDPITGEQRRVSIPPAFKSLNISGAVLCAADDLGHVHGGCHSSPFKVVLVSTYHHIDKYHPIACVYSSEAGIWGDTISTEAPCGIFGGATPAILVGNVLYWLFGRDPTRMSDDILVLDLDRQNLVVTVGPTLSNDFLHGDRQIIQAKNGAVGLAILLCPRLQMWQRNVSCQGVATWMPWKTFEMHSIFGLSIQIEGEVKWLQGYDEVNDVIFIQVSHSVYAVQLKSMESKKLYENYCSGRIHPFTSFYIPGTSIDGRSNGAKMLHSAYDDCLV